MRAGQNLKKKKKCRWFKVLYATLTVVIHTASEHCTVTPTSVEFYHLHVDTSIVFDHKYCPHLTLIYQKNYAVRKVANFESHARWNYKACSPCAHAHNWPNISLLRRTVPIQLCAGYSTLLISAPCPVNSGRFIQLAMLLLNNPRVIFVSFATFQSVSFW